MNAVLLPARLQGPLGGSWWLLALCGSIYPASLQRSSAIRRLDF